MSSTLIATVARCAVAGVVVVLLSGGLAAAQCVGDCGNDDEVTIEEILTMVTIAQGTAPISSCLAADADGGGDVTIDEILIAVNNAQNGCPTVSTPTPTLTPTPTSPGTFPTKPPQPTPLAGCGNGTVDFANGETCDDGNTDDGDSCPSNCRVVVCSPSGSTVDVTVVFAPPVDLSGITVFLDYPDTLVRIPGRFDAEMVGERITGTPENAALQYNDLNYALRTLFFTPDNSVIPASMLMTVTFDNCDGAPAPTAADFRCCVESATDTNSAAVEGALCAVEIP